MVRVKSMVYKGAIKKISSGNWMSKRYEAYVKEFGEGNFGLVEVSDLEKEINGIEETPVYLLKKGLKVEPFPKKGINCDLFLAEEFKLIPGIPTNIESATNILNYLEQKEINGEIGKFINSKKATLYGDHLSLIEFSKKGFPVPETLHFKDFSSFEKFIINSNKNYVVKHRFSCDGIYNFLMNKNNYEQLRNLGYGMRMNDFVVQPELNIKGESRIIFYKDEFLGARMIIDRTRPWEEKAVAGRKHECKPYIPKQDELKIAKGLFEYIGADLGCIDMLHLNGGELLVLEYNGVGTGYGHKGGPYNLNNLIFSKLKKEYL